MKSFAFSHMFFCEKEKARNLHIKWVVPSEWLLKKCMLSGISEKRIQVIKNGITLDDYREKDVNKLKEKYGDKIFGLTESDRADLSQLMQGVLIQDIEIILSE